MTVLSAGMLTAIPVLLQTIIDHGILRRDTAVVLWTAGVVAGLAVVNALLAVGQRWYSARVGEGLIYDLRTEVFSHVQRQPVAFFTRAQTGSLVSRLNSDIISAQQALTSTLSGAVSNIVSLVLTLAAMLWLSWPVTVAALALIPLFLLPARPAGRRLQRLTRESMQLDAEMGAAMTERFNVAGAILVKLYGHPGPESRMFAQRAARVRDIGVTTAMYGTALYTGMTLLASLAAAVAHGLGGWLVIRGTFQLGALAALPGAAVRAGHRPGQHAGGRDDRAGQLRPDLRGARPQADDHPAPRRAAAAAAGERQRQRHGARARTRDLLRPGVVPVPRRPRGVAGLARIHRAARAGTGRQRPGRAA
jgi:ATP-binding cassette subfamily B protein